jgi:hypothetical protein
MGFVNNVPYPLTTENGVNIITEDGVDILSDELVSGGIAISFDSTGLFALSSEDLQGVGIDDVKKNSLIIRDTSGVIFNETVDSLLLSMQSDNETTLRFRYINKIEISVDLKINNLYSTIARVPINTNFDSDDRIYPYFFYTSPVSSSESSDVTFYMKNFHVQGNSNPPTFSLK